MTMEANFPFFPRCLECGGQMELTQRRGRTRELVKGVHLPIPDDFRIPTCQSCGDEVWSPEMSDALDAQLGKQVGGVIRGYVEHLSDRFDVTQAQVASACRVTHTYLSHVTHGRKMPSGTLVELLSIFEEVDGAFEHAFPSVKKSRVDERIGKLVGIVPHPAPVQESVSAGTFGDESAEWKDQWPTDVGPVAAHGA
jgi:hypothetical protein